MCNTNQSNRSTAVAQAANYFCLRCPFRFVCASFSFSSSQFHYVWWGSKNILVQHYRANTLHALWLWLHFQEAHYLALARCWPSQNVCLCASTFGPPNVKLQPSAWHCMFDLNGRFFSFYYYRICQIHTWHRRYINFVTEAIRSKHLNWRCKGNVDNRFRCCSLYCIRSFVAFFRCCCFFVCLFIFWSCVLACAFFSQNCWFFPFPNGTAIHRNPSQFAHTK